MKKTFFKKINKEITSYNRRLKQALKKGNIDKNTYEVLLIDKAKKDFYKSTIFTKKQFKKFTSLLNKANTKTLQPSKRIIKNIGENFNEIAKTRFEKEILKEQLKKDKYLKETFGHRYSDYIMNVAQDKHKYENFLERLLKMDFAVESKDARYIENWKQAYKKRFGKAPRFKIEDKRIIKEMLKNPNLDIDTFYDPFRKDREIEDDVKRQIREIREKIKKGDYTEDDDIDIDELIYG